MLSGGFGEPYCFGRRISKKLRDTDYDIIHDNQSLSYGLVDLQNAGHTVISTIHHPIHRDREIALASAKGLGHRLLVKRWHHFLNMQENVAAQLKHIVTVSQQSQRDIANYFKRCEANTPVIVNGVDTEFFCPRASIATKPLSLLTTNSSDHPLKGLQVLLRALKQIVRTQPEARLTIIGKLKKNGESENLIHQLQLNDHIDLRYGLSDTELVDAYNRHSIYICPSLYEGFGLPLAEAMSCARAVIGSDGGAIPEIVGDAGFIVSAGDDSALAARVLQIWEDEALRERLGTLARMRILQHFSWTRVAEKLSLYYRQCLKGN